MEKQRLEILACNAGELKTHWVTRQLLEGYQFRSIDLEDEDDSYWVDDHDLFSQELKRMGFRRIYNYKGASADSLVGGVYVNRSAGLVVKLHYVNQCLKSQPGFRRALLESPLYCPALLLSNGWEIQEWLRPAPRQSGAEALYYQELWEFMVDQRDWGILKPSLVELLRTGGALIGLVDPGVLQTFSDPALQQLAGELVSTLDFCTRNLRADRDGKLFIIDI